MNKQKKGLKAILALLLTLTLVIGMVPASALAETADAITDGTQIVDTMDGSTSTGDATTPTEGETETTPEDATTTPGTEDETATPTEETTPAEGDGQATAATNAAPTANEEGGISLYNMYNENVDNKFDPYTVTDTVSPQGTTIDVFDYWITNQNDSDIEDDNGNSDGINMTEPNGTTYHALRFGASAGGRGSDTQNKYTESSKPQFDIVANKMGDDGYPTVRMGGNESLAYLFDPDIDHEGKASYANAQGLLQVDSDGYYYYDSKQNFASFVPGDNGAANTFKVYNASAVKRQSSSSSENNKGQFFPFNSPSDVFQTQNNGNPTTDNNGLLVARTDIKSDQETDWPDRISMNHYFGMHMSTRFIQQYNGRVSAEQNSAPVTYEFSGDDDVWIFIDGVLVGDLGGIHQESSISINFQTGDVIIYDDANGNGQYDKGIYPWDDSEERYNNENTTLRSLFQDSGADTTGWNGNTFANDTYHTLDFFYLERGGDASNMSLKYNLVTVPESNIIKIDQVGNEVPGAEFELYLADEDYDYTGNQPLCTVTTDSNGEAVLENTATNKLMTIQNLEDEWIKKYLGSGAGNEPHFVLVETETPQGYRSAEEMQLRLVTQNGNTVLLSTNHWETGAYASAKVRTVAPTNPQYYTEGNSGGTTLVSTNNNDGTINGVMFAVVMKYTGPVDKDGNATSDGLASTQNWKPVYGDPENGWTVSETGDMAAILAAAKANTYEFHPESDGPYKVDVTNMPGDILTYYYMLDEDYKNQAKYTVAYFYYEGADSVSAIQENNANNIKVLDTDGTVQGNNDYYSRVFSVNLYVPNISNVLLVQKVDQNGTALEGATFGLYSDAACQIPYPDESNNTRTTQNLSKENKQGIDLDGAAVFDKLPNGVYYLKETAPPAGYAENPTVTKVIVNDDGVFADAGTDEDGISVLKGAGSIVKSLKQFATDDGIDVSLHDVQTAIATGTPDATNSTQINWGKVDWDNQSLHLTYNPENAPLDYKTNSSYYQKNNITEPANPFIEIKEGWAMVHVKQDSKNNNSASTKESANWTDLSDEGRNNDGDLTPLFSITTTVQVENQKIGDLTISKDVTGAENDTTPFNFTVRLDNITGNVTYDVNDVNKVKVENQPLSQDEGNTVAIGDDNTVNITLQDGGTITFTNLNEGQKYTVTETSDTTGYVTQNTVNNNLSQNDKTTGIQTLNGSTTNNVVFTNEKTYSLDVRKILTMANPDGGDYTDRTKDFTVEVTLTDGTNSIADVDLDSIKAMNGDEVVSLREVAGKAKTYSFTVKGDQTVTLSGIPYDAQFSVVETGLESSRYTASYKQGVKDEELTDYNNSKVSMNSANHAVEITNTMSDVPVTGSFFDNNATNVLMVIASIAILALAALGIWRYKRTHA